MCGGDLELLDNASVCVCDYCGTKQTVPKADNEKKIKLFERANRLRMSNEFDKAYGLYESIVEEFNNEAEAYWGLVLCRYGIEYVDDPKTGNKVPTCHRSSFESILDDGNFELAIKNADVVARKVYQEEAEAIEEIRKGIIEISSKEDPYDIFICYKETDEKGERTIDSVIAQDVYEALVDKKYRVFFARISLEDKLGKEYEPYIFSALHSAKVMLVFGTSYEYFNAVWVKNEWSRYLKLLEQGENKALIPCYKGIDAYDMPKEFARLQAQDMGKVGAIQDLLRGIGKIIPRKDKTERVQANALNSFAEPLVARGMEFLKNGTFAKAQEFFEKAIDYDPSNEKALIGALLVECKVKTIDELLESETLYGSFSSYTMLLSNCSDEIIQRLESGKIQIRKRIVASGYKSLEAQNYFHARDCFAKVVFDDPNNESALLGMLLVENDVCSLDELLAGENTFDGSDAYASLLNVCSDEIREKLVNGRTTICNNLVNRAADCLYDRDYSIATQYLDKALTIVPNNEDALIGKILVEYRTCSLEELIEGERLFHNSLNYLTLLEHGSQETKEILENGIEQIKERLYKNAQECLDNGDFAGAKSRYLEIITLEDGEKSRLGVFLADAKANSISNLVEKKVLFQTLDSYKKYYEACSTESKEQIENAYEEIKNIYYSTVEEKLKIKQYLVASNIATVVLEDSPNDVRAIELMLFTNFGVSSWQELRETYEPIAKNRWYQKLLTVGSEEDKKRAQECEEKIQQNIQRRIKQEKRKKRNKIIAIVSSVAAIVIAIIITGLIYFNSNSYIYGMELTEDGRGYIITESNHMGDGGKVVVPSEIDGIPVIAIGKKAFYDREDITEVEIQSGIESIGSQAFRNCCNLTKLTVPDTVVSIEDISFVDCDNFVEITGPALLFEKIRVSDYYESNYQSYVTSQVDMLDELRDYYGYEGLKEYEEYYKEVFGVDILEDIYEVDDYYDYYDLGWKLVLPIQIYNLLECYPTLKKVNITSGESIPNGIFSGCENLESVILSNGITSIGESAFNSCSSLTSITIPSSVMYVAGAFSDCEALTIYCEVPKRPTGWYEHWTSDECPVVWNCKNNQKAVFYDYYENEEKYAYFTVVDGIRYMIYDGDAWVTRQPTNITVANIRSIITFEGCDYTVIGIEEWAFYYCSNLASVEIPNTVIEIGSKAFYDCDALKTVFIPSSVQYIETDAFNKCETIYCEATSKPYYWDYDWYDRSNIIYVEDADGSGFYKSTEIVWGYSPN